MAGRTGRATRPSSLLVGAVVAAEVAAAVEETTSRPASEPTTPAWRTVPVAKAAYPPAGAAKGATPAAEPAPPTGARIGASSDPASRALAATVDDTAMAAAKPTASRMRLGLPRYPMIRPSLTTERGKAPCGPVCSTRTVKPLPKRSLWR